LHLGRKGEAIENIERGIEINWEPETAEEKKEEAPNKELM